MKTFLFDTFNRYKRLSESLDVETTLCNKTWFVFNNSGEREIYIFQEKGKLKISLNGKVTHATWEYIPANKSLIISGNEQSYMVHAAYVDNILFALQIDGTNEYAFLIDENSKQNFLPQSYNDIKQYFQIKEQELIQKQEFERLENKRLLAQKREEERLQEKERIADELRQRAEDIKYPNSLEYFIYVIWGTISVVLAILLLFLPGFCDPNHTLLNIGRFALCAALIFFFGIIGILCLIFPIIGKRRAKKWKEKHPNDPVNQYL